MKLKSEQLMNNGKTKNNLLVVTDSYPNADLTYTKCIFVKKTIDNIRDYFAKITVISPLLKSFNIRQQNRKCQNYSYENIKVYYPRSLYLPQKYKEIYKINIDKREKKVINTINKYNIDFNLIHAHFGPMGKLCVGLSKKQKKPLLTSFYGYDAYMSCYENNYYDSLFNTAACIISLSRHMTERLNFLGCNKSKIEQINIGIDVQKFKPN